MQPTVGPPIQLFAFRIFLIQLDSASNATGNYCQSLLTIALGK